MHGTLTVLPLKVTELCFAAGGATLICNISFVLGAGSRTVIMGPNGAGKSLVLRLCHGLIEPSGGRIEWAGPPGEGAHKRHAMVFQRPVMLRRTALANVVHALNLAGVGRRERHLRAEQALDRFGLSSLVHRPARLLSGGEQQRLSLALALVGRPQVVFLDEPTAGVDVTGRQLVRALIRELRDHGVTVVLTTHELAEAEQVADHVVIVDRGRLVAAGTLDELLHDGPADVRFAAAPGLDIAALGQHLNAGVTEVAPGSYVVAAPPDPVLVAAITAWLADRDEPLGDLRAGRRTLEDVFLRLTTGAP